MSTLSRSDRSAVVAVLAAAASDAAASDPSVANFVDVIAVRAGRMPNATSLRLLVRELSIDEDALFSAVSPEGRRCLDAALGFRPVPGRPLGTTLAVELRARDHEAFVNFARTAMEQRGVTKRDLADAAGVSVYDVANIVARCSARPSSFVYCAVAASLAFDPNDGATSAHGQELWRAAFALQDQARLAAVRRAEPTQLVAPDLSLMADYLRVRVEHSGLTRSDMIRALPQGTAALRAIETGNGVTLRHVMAVAGALDVESDALARLLQPERRPGALRLMEQECRVRPVAPAVPSAALTPSVYRLSLSPSTWSGIVELVRGTLAGGTRQQELARRAGLDDSRISRLLKGTEQPGAIALVRVLDAAGVTDADLADRLPPPAYEEYRTVMAAVDVPELEVLYGRAPHGLATPEATEIDDAAIALLPSDVRAVMQGGGSLGR